MSLPQKPLKVFYLDDESDLLEIFIETFQTDSIRITGFSEPRLYIEACCNEAPDLLFIDFRLPSITGNDVGLELDQRLGKGPPKYIVTGDLKVELKADFAGIFYKPFNLERIEELLQKHQLLKAA